MISQQDYAPTTTSLVRPPRRPRQAAPAGQPPAAGAQPYGGNGVLPQPPAQPMPYAVPTGVNMVNAKAPPAPTPIGGIPGAPPPAAAPPAPPPLPPGAPAGASAIDPNANLRGVQINPVNAADTNAARAGAVAATTAVQNRATPQVDFQTVGKRLDYRPVNTQAGFTKVDPNVALPGVNTQATFKGVDPNAAFRGVNTTVAGGPAVDPTASARLTGQQGMVDTEAAKLAGVDRLKLAQEQFGTYANATDPEYQATIRDATEAAAAHGGLGSGMLTTRYGTLAGDRANALTTERDRLFQTAQEGSIADQFAKVAALQGLSSQTAGEEAAARGEQRTERGYTTDLAGANVARTQAERDAELGASERNIGRTQAERDAALAAEQSNIARATTERDTGTALAERNVGRTQAERDAALAADERGIGRTQQERDAQAAIDQANLGLDVSERDKGVDVAGANADRTTTDDYRKVGAANDLFSSLSGQDAAARGEVRTERTNQQNEAQAAEDSAVRQTQLEEALKSGDFERALALAQYGDAGNPGPATIGVGAQQGEQSGQDLQGLLALLQQYGYNQAAKPKAA